MTGLTPWPRVRRGTVALMRCVYADLYTHAPPKSLTFAMGDIFHLDLFHHCQRRSFLPLGFGWHSAAGKVAVEDGADLFAAVMGAARRRCCALLFFLLGLNLRAQFLECSTAQIAKVTRWSMRGTCSRSGNSSQKVTLARLTARDCRASARFSASLMCKVSTDSAVSCMSDRMA